MASCKSMLAGYLPNNCVDLSTGGIWCRKVGVKGAHLLRVLVLTDSDDEALLFASALGLELDLGLAGELLLSSAQLEQSRSQPQDKGSPGAGGLSLSGVVSVS